MFATEIITLIVLTVLNMTLGIFAFIKKPERKTNIYFLILTSSIVSWIISIFMLINFDFFPYLSSEFLARLPFLTIIFFVWSLLYFSFHFPVENKLSRKIHYLINIPTIAVFILTAGPFIVDSFVVRNTLPFAVYGPLFFVFIVYFLSFIVWALSVLLRKFKSASGIQRTQLKFLFIGLGLTILLGAITNLFLPLIFSGTIIYQLGPFSTIIFIFLTSYSMIRLRLFDMRIKLQEILNYTLPFFIVVPVMAVIAEFLHQYFDASELVIAITILIPGSIAYKYLYGLISRTPIGHYLFRSTFLYQKALLQLSKKASSILDMDLLAEKTVEVFHEQMGVEDVIIVISSSATGKYRVLKKCCALNKIDAKKYIHLPSDVKKRLAETGEPLIREELKLLIEYAEIDEVKKYKKSLDFLRLIDVEICLPLYLQESLIGYIFLGKKGENLNYTEEDISLFVQTSRNLATAFANSILHETKENQARVLKEEVEEQTMEIKELYEMKSNFLTVASHQLRTPTSIIRGMLSMLVEEDFSPKKKDEMIEAAFKSSSSLERVIDDILTAAEIDSARFEFDPEPVDVVPIAARIVEDLQLKAEKKGVKLHMTKPRTKKVIALTNKSKIEQAFVNLVDNALNYTAEGSVKVRISSEKYRGREYVSFECIDTGVGMTKADMRKIGEKFFRSRNVFSVHPNGTGLGIYIVKQVVKASKGKLVLESDGLGKGSTFKILLKKPKKK